MQFKQDENAMCTEKIGWPNANAKIGLQNFVPAISILRMHHGRKGLFKPLQYRQNKVVGRCKSSNNNSRHYRKIKSIKGDRSQAHETSRINIQAWHMGCSCFYRTERLLDAKATIHFYCYRRRKEGYLQQCKAQEIMVLRGWISSNLIKARYTPKKKDMLSLWITLKNTKLLSEQPNSLIS